MRRLRFAILLCALTAGIAALCAGPQLFVAAYAAPKALKGQAAPPAGGDDMPVEGDDASIPVEPGVEEQAQARPIPPAFGPPAPVTLTAYLSEGSAPMMSDVTWRIFEARSASDGNYRLLSTLREPRPTLELKPGEYLINVAYGRANVTKKVGVWPEKPIHEDFIVNAGGLRLTATLARAPVAQEHLLKFELFADTQDQSGNRQRLFSDLRPGVVTRLNSGVYHIVSTYGDANSVITADIVIEPGKITEAGIDHDAGKVTFRLVQRYGGEAVADTRWTIYNSIGEVIKESAGAFPTHVLAAGDYRVAAQHGERLYASIFSVAAGDGKLVEVLMQ
jgi:hypothetical protein